MPIWKAAISFIPSDLNEPNTLYKKKKFADYEVITNAYDIDHPTPYIDEGVRLVNCLTDISRLSKMEQAALLYRVDSRL